MPNNTDGKSITGLKHRTNVTTPVLNTKPSNDDKTKPSNDDKWKILHIYFRGFPMYACGHDYVLLKDPDGWILAHLKIEVPTTISADKKIPCCFYSLRFACTNTLGATIVIYTGEKIPEQLEKIRKQACVFYCTEYEITKEKGLLTRKKIENQADKKEPLDPFLLYGNNDYIKGSNCMDWRRSLLKYAGAAGSGKSVSNEELKNMYNQHNSKPTLRCN